MPTLREMTERVFDLWYRVQRCFFSEECCSASCKPARAPRHIARPAPSVTRWLWSVDQGPQQERFEAYTSTCPTVRRLGRSEHYRLRAARWGRDIIARLALERQILPEGKGLG